MSKSQKYLLVLGIALLIVAPVLLTQSSFLSIFNFSDTGQVGDTIGGITAPIVNLIGAFLVYMSFKQQLIANKQQQTELRNEITRNNNLQQYNSYIHYIEMLRNEINDYEYLSSNGKNIKSTNGLIKHTNYFNEHLFDSINNGTPDVNSLFLFNIIGAIANTVVNIQQSELSVYSKEDLFKKIGFIYYVKLYTPVRQLRNKIATSNNELVKQFIKNTELIEKSQE